MNSLIWNIRGLGGNSSQQQLWYLINSLKLNVFAIMEPLVNLDVFYFCNKFRMDKVVSNRTNKIWVFSDIDYDVEVVEDYAQYLHCKISSAKLPCHIFMTYVYAKCTRHERYALCDGLKQYAHSNSPWSIGGDFNIITAVEERKGGSPPNLNAINDFCECIMDCGMSDIGYEGLPFTWKGGQMEQRLDRILFNHSWLDTFLVNKVTHGVRRVSDHRPLLLAFNTSVIARRSTFRFQNMWLIHPDCISGIANHWAIPARNVGLKKFWEKLQRLKQHLTWWNKYVFGNLFLKLEKEEAKVTTAEEDYHLNPTPENQFKCSAAAKEFQTTLDMEESFWRQKAGSRWLLDGDRNTKLFHNMVKRKRSKGRINSINDGTSVISDPERLHDSAISFFSSLFRDDISITEEPDLCNFPPFVDQEINAALCETPSLEEIKQVVFGLKREASAGPDGYTTHFYQACWDIIKVDLLEAIEDYFQGSPLPLGFTATSLALIPKSSSPSSWSDYRPISLCNASHKIISKLLNDRLGAVLPCII